MQSDQINELATALAKCQAELQPAIKNSKNPFFKSNYADLADCWAACKEPLSKHGLSVVQTMCPEGDKTLMNTTLMHVSGQWIRSTMPVICAKPGDPQAWGSALSYMRRYTLCAIVGITAGDDDDGNSASPNGNGHKNGNGNHITQDQVRALNEALDKCPADYVESVRSTLKQMGIVSFDKITLELFDRLISAAEKNHKS